MRTGTAIQAGVVAVSLFVTELPAILPRASAEHFQYHECFVRRTAFMEERVPHPIAQALAKIGLPLLQKLSARLLDQGFLEKAISATADDFSGIEIHHGLRAWCNSASFSEILDRFIETGERDFDDEELVGSFIDAAAFYYGDGTNARAAEVLQGFFRRLAEALYGSAKAVPALAGRFEYLLTQVVTTNQALLDRLADDLVTLSEHQDPSIVARIDAAKDLLNKGRPSGALVLLEPLEAEIRNGSITGALSYRVVMNLGVIAMMAKDYGKAQIYFNSALIYRPDDAKALANLAQIALLQDRTQEAFDWIQRARKSGPSDAYVAAMLICCLQSRDKLSDIEALIAAEPWILKDAQCVLMVGEADYRQGNFDTARLGAQTALDLDNGIARAWDLLGRAELASAQIKLRSDPPLPWRLPEEASGLLLRAEASFSRAVALLENQENLEALAGVVANRGTARMLIGDASGALADFDRSMVLASDPDIISKRPTNPSTQRPDRAA